MKVIDQGEEFKVVYMCVVAKDRTTFFYPDIKVISIGSNNDYSFSSIVVENNSKFYCLYRHGGTNAWLRTLHNSANQELIDRLIRLAFSSNPKPSGKPWVSGWWKNKIKP